MPGANDIEVAATWAMSLDGKIATAHGESPRLAGRADLANLLAQRAAADALIVGASTVRTIDPPMAPAPAHAARAALVVVISGTGRVPANARALSRPPLGQPPWLVTARAAPPLTAELQAKVSRSDLVHLRLPMQVNQPSRIDVHELVRHLAAAGRTRILIEGGGETLWPFVEADLLDAVDVTIAPMLLGGPAPSPVGGAGLLFDRRLRLQLCGVERREQEVALQYRRGGVPATAKEAR